MLIYDWASFPGRERMFWGVSFPVRKWNKANKPESWDRVIPGPGAGKGMGHWWCCPALVLATAPRFHFEGTQPKRFIGGGPAATPPSRPTFREGHTPRPGHLLPNHSLPQLLGTGAVFLRGLANWQDVGLLLLKIIVDTKRDSPLRTEPLWRNLSHIQLGRV